MVIRRNGHRARRVRQADVAAAAGVSQAAVSVALGEPGSGTTRLSNRTREHIVKTATGLGYTVNPAARNLVGGRNRLFGVHTFEPVFPLDAQNFFQEFLVGIEQAAERTGYDLLLLTSAAVPGGRRQVYSGGLNRLALSDGSILLGREENADEIERLVKERFPFVFIGRRESPAGPVSYVTCAYQQATRQVLEQMISHGHRRLAYVGRALPLPDLDQQARWDEIADSLDLTLLVRPTDDRRPAASPGIRRG